MFASSRSSRSKPRHLEWTSQLARCRVHQPREVGRVTLADDFGLATGLQRLRGVCVHGLQHRKTGLAGRLVLFQQTPVEQGFEHVDNRCAQWIAHGFGGFQVAASSKDPQPTEDYPLLGAQQIMAPRQRGAQGLVALRVVAASTLQYVETRLESGQHRLRWQRPYPRRGELERQRQPVETSTQLGHRRRIFGRQLKHWLDLVRTLNEQLDRGYLAECLHIRGCIRWRCRQGADELQPFATQPQRLAAGGQHDQVRTGLEQLAEARRGLEQVLAIVDHQQKPSATQEQPQAIGKRQLPGCTSHPQRAGNRR